MALRMTALQIPQHVVLNETVRMQCNFNLDKELLYSVKWYKDGHEFYRYVPRDVPMVQTFRVPGVNVNIHNSTEISVVLNNVNLTSSGRYRCEVSAEAPAFQTVSDHADMTVVVLPDEGPRITGGRSRYQVGEVVRMNCTSAPSKPAALLTWFINGDANRTSNNDVPRQFKILKLDKETCKNLTGGDIRRSAPVPRQFPSLRLIPMSKEVPRNHDKRSPAERAADLKRSSGRYPVPEGTAHYRRGREGLGDRGIGLGVSRGQQTLQAGRHEAQVLGHNSDRLSAEQGGERGRRREDPESPGDGEPRDQGAEPHSQRLNQW
ncbi:hypothetical protein K0M31_015222 [Melipona bicolor]|uniref:Ig-like domain-containing protein n=1 Tax=Melipona bicolor TaxID=60889 RepID=A0AA40KFC8_9HYME|nr:hypothetical protein K0M31_015222 [Melipona bicolor]